VSRNIDDAGFTAQWKILHLNRSYPQIWIGNEYNINNSEFGVRLLMPVDEYQKTTRTAKYAIMFIALTFLSFFMIEMLARRIMHPIHYILIGFALLVFYTLLLSLSEYLSFNSAYLISSLSIILLITGYTKSILKSYAYTSLILIILLVLYSYFYIILQMQDYALMMGSVALFTILGIVMYVTRKTDWFVVLQTKTTVDKTV
jgi:inner membrane protein